MNLLFLFIYMVWFISEIALNRIFKSGDNDMKNMDKGSIYLLWGLIIVGNFLAVMASINFPQAISLNSFAAYSGLFLIVLGVSLRLWVITTLGKHFTVTVTIRENHTLKTDGIYKFIRHPSYAASLLSFIGFGFSLNNWYSVLIAFGFVFIAFQQRIRIEENTLIAHFGKEYLTYMKTSRKLIPFIY
ncbi:MAG: isoprenylcysteine carboxylmethyltransferase family protein [Bacteroidales bacterium]|nr:isoprenylcysteine carboxylmethyltransferase family protein [Bacteroidales bacterium]MCB9013646.1 isoprenylcysteine carboxylmethyltransferase family protein [Bacteroidales bacterium]